MEKTGNFLKGLLFGAVVGAVAGVLLAPKAGKETREDLMKMASKVKRDATDSFEKARALVMEKATALRTAGKKIDQERYLGIVSEVVNEFKNDKEVTVDAAKRLGSQLRRDWNKVKTAFNSTAQTSK